MSLRTAQLWVEKGILDAWKTSGGHRRISKASVENFLEGKTLLKHALPGSPTSTGKLRILIVEDNNTLRKLYKTIIGNWGLPLEIVTANNGIEALILIGRTCPDLMITDLAMPGLDGFQLIRSLASSALSAGMDIVVVTGLDVADIPSLGGLPGDIHVFPKPVPFSELYTLAGGLIAQRASSCCASGASAL